MAIAVKGMSVILILLMLAIMAWLMIPVLVNAVQQMPTTSHAVMRHGVDAIYARECMNGWELKMYNPQTQRTGLICMTSAGKFGIVILDRFGEEVTAFLREKNKTLEQVIRYMQRRGYELLQ
jgi:hypothetical protein